MKETGEPTWDDKAVGTVVGFLAMVLVWPAAFIIGAIAKSAIQGFMLGMKANRFYWDTLPRMPWKCDTHARREVHHV